MTQRRKLCGQGLTKLSAAFPEPIEGAQISHTPGSEVNAKHQHEVTDNPGGEDHQSYKHGTTPFRGSVAIIGYQVLPATRFLRDGWVA